MLNNIRKRHTSILLISIFLYLCSIALPVFIYRPASYADDYGFAALLFGWLAIFGPWYANVLYFIAVGLAFARLYWVVFGFSIIAFVWGLTSFSFIGTAFDASLKTRVITHLAIGFYVWEAAFILLALYGLLNALSSPLTSLPVSDALPPSAEME